MVLNVCLGAFFGLVFTYKATQFNYEKKDSQSMNKQKTLLGLVVTALVLLSLLKSIGFVIGFSIAGLGVLNYCCSIL